MSKTSVIYPIITALSNAAQHVEAKTPWTTVNENQSTLLENFYSKMEKEANSIKDIQTRVSHVVEELNSWMKERGFEIQLKPFEKPEDFGVVSILDVLVEWIEPGRKTTILKDDKSFQAVKISSDNSDVMMSTKHPNPIAVLETKSGERVCLTVAEQELSGFELTNKCCELSKSKTQIHKYGDVIFPMVSLNQEVDISWLKNLWCIGNDSPSGNIAKVAQAFQQTKFRMNEIGARAESAVAIGMMRCASVRYPPPPLVIDKPFLAWIERDNLSMPLFTAYVTEEDWKDPGTLK